MHPVVLSGTHQPPIQPGMPATPTAFCWRLSATTFRACVRSRAILLGVVASCPELAAFRAGPCLIPLKGDAVGELLLDGGVGGAQSWPQQLIVAFGGKGTTVVAPRGETDTTVSGEFGGDFVTVLTGEVWGEIWVWQDCKSMRVEDFLGPQSKTIGASGKSSPTSSMRGNRLSARFSLLNLAAACTSVLCTGSSPLSGESSFNNVVELPSALRALMEELLPLPPFIVEVDI
mmetsp:Transcript_151075/g.281738  ORF Transcript_151075/g.281738 Transcript_151075/m.281738 type:complete len:231 (+) Transcript_151075:10-702(+)